MNINWDKVAYPYFIVVGCCLTMLAWLTQSSIWSLVAILSAMSAFACSMYAGIVTGPDDSDCC
jgi:hypothetical protein